MKLLGYQKNAYELIKDGYNVFITGSSGTGKSSIIKKIVKDNKSNYYNKNIVVTSTTGASAIIIGGVTIHSYLGIGLGKDELYKLYNKIIKKKWIMKRWLDIEILVIDEVSMLSHLLFDKIEELARLIRDSEEPFGGIQLVITGDWCQLPCVNSDKFCFEAKSWDRCIQKVVYLEKIIRQNNIEFQRCLNKIRVGNIDEEVIKILESRIGKKLENDSNILPTKLFSLRSNVSYINDIELDKLAIDGRQFNEYKPQIRILDDSKRKTMENIQRQSKITPIQLCVGAQVMLSINLDFENKLINGSRGIVTKFVGDLPSVKFINGLERVIDFCKIKNYIDNQIIGYITYIPLKVAFAISIHSCQGSTLDYVEIDLSNIFEYGQAYVALSRIKNIDGLSITNLKPNLIKAHPKAIEYYKNIKK